MAVGVWFVAAKTGEDQSDGMARCHQHRSQKNGHVVAVAGAQFQHATRGMQKLDAKDVPRVADVPAHKVEQSTDLAEAILRTDLVCAENLNCLLPHVEILGTVANHPRNYPGCDERSFSSLWDSVNPNTRYGESAA